MENDQRFQMVMRRVADGRVATAIAFRRFRKSLGYVLSDLAEITGISATLLWRVEVGSRRITDDEIQTISLLYPAEWARLQIERNHAQMALQGMDFSQMRLQGPDLIEKLSAQIFENEGMRPFYRCSELRPGITQSTAGVFLMPKVDYRDYMPVMVGPAGYGHMIPGNSILLVSRAGLSRKALKDGRLVAAFINGALTPAMAVAGGLRPVAKLKVIPMEDVGTVHDISMIIPTPETAERPQDAA